MTGSLVVTAPDGVGEVREGDDLAGVLLAHCELADGDVVVVTSKVVSKAEGRLRPGDRSASLAGETAHLVARRGPTTIVRTHLGLTMAAAGIDASNVAPGHHLLLPRDPDGTARSLRHAVAARAGHNVAVVVSDTAGRAWRTGQTDIAIGAAGLRVSEQHAGRTDGYGNALLVTEPAVADEIAGVAELVTGKLGGRPVSVLRGRADLVLPTGEDGPGARALVRAEGEDLFGLGAREAVVRALAGSDRGLFGAPAPAGDLLDALSRALPHVRVVAETPDVLVHGMVGDEAGRTALDLLGFAFGWDVAPGSGTDAATTVRLRPATP